MQYNRKISQIINNIVDTYYPYQTRYGDARANGCHRIKYVGSWSVPNRLEIERIIQKEIEKAGIKVISAKFFESSMFCYQHKYLTFTVHLNKNNC